MASKGSFKKEHPRKSKSKEKEDVTWILEGIVAYLQSPTWRVPVLNFVEENCGVFVTVEENKFEYTDIHTKYKQMVESLLQRYMKELELSESQFSKACSKHNRDIAKMENGFEYIWAADDFLLFKELMLKNNMKVEMEALHMMQQNYQDKGREFNDEDAEMIDKLLKSKSKDRKKICEKQEEEDILLAIQFSKMEMERLKALADEEKRLMEEAIRLSLQSSSAQSVNITENYSASTTRKQESLDPFILTKPVHIDNTTVAPPEDFSVTSLTSPPTYQKPEEERKSKKENPERKKQSSNEKTSIQESKTKELPPIKAPPEKSSSDAAAAWLDQAMKEITESPIHAVQRTSNNTKQGGIDPEEMAKRRAYLQSQREKLLAQKKMQRNRELSEYNEEIQANGKKQISEKAHGLDPEEEKKLAARRAVAERLKREVINRK